MICGPGELCSATVFELNGILIHISPLVSAAPPYDLKIAVGHIAVLIKSGLIVCL